jgi:hypothetical protein
MPPYNDKIDDIIISILMAGEKKYSELNTEIEKTYKKISPDVLVKHLSLLISKELISKESSSRNTIKYFLTQKGLLEQEFKVLEARDIDKIDSKKLRHVIIYALLLVMMNRTHRWIETEEEFSKFLFEHGLTTKDLIQKFHDKHPHRKDPIGIYQLTRYGPINDIIIIKYLYTRSFEGKNTPFTVYRCSAKEFSVDQILDSDNRPAFGYMNLSPEEVNDTIDLLKQKGIIKPVRIHGNILYSIASQSLENLLVDCYQIYEILRYDIIFNWRYLRRPTENEIRWLELFEGKKRTSELRVSAYFERHRKLQKRAKLDKKERSARERVLKETSKSWQDGIDQMILELKKKHEKTIKNTKFPVEKILEIFLPEHIRKLVPKTL